MPTDDRPDLRGDATLIPVPGVVAEFEIHAVEKLAIVRIRNREQQPDLAPVNRASESFGDAVERQVEPGFEPTRHTIGPLGHSVEGPVGNDAAGKSRGLESGRGEVVVQGEIEDAPGREAAVVHLNFVGLGEGQLRQGKGE